MAGPAYGGAGVAQALQGVIFTQKTDAGAALAVAELGPEGGLHPPVPVSTWKPLWVR